MSARLFSEFFDSVISVVKSNREKRESDAIRKTMASEERLNHLSDKVSRGRDAKKFIDGDFWIDHLEPYLRSEAILKPAVLKEGDPAPTKRAFQEFLIGSGRVQVLTRLISRLESWQAEGEEALKILELEAEKKKALQTR